MYLFDDRDEAHYDSEDDHQLQVVDKKREIHELRDLYEEHMQKLSQGTSIGEVLDNIETDLTNTTTTILDIFSVNAVVDTVSRLEETDGSAEKHLLLVPSFDIEPEFTSLLTALQLNNNGNYTGILHMMRAAELATSNSPRQVGIRKTLFADPSGASLSTAIKSPREIDLIDTESAEIVRVENIAQPALADVFLHESLIAERTFLDREKKDILLGKNATGYDALALQTTKILAALDEVDPGLRNKLVIVPIGIGDSKARGNIDSYLFGSTVLEKNASDGYASFNNSVNLLGNYINRSRKAIDHTRESFQEIFNISLPSNFGWDIANHVRHFISPYDEQILEFTDKRGRQHLEPHFEAARKILSQLERTGEVSEQDWERYYVLGTAYHYLALLLSTLFREGSDRQTQIAGLKMVYEEVDKLYSGRAGKLSNISTGGDGNNQDFLTELGVAPRMLGFMVMLKKQSQSGEPFADNARQTRQKPNSGGGVNRKRRKRK